MTWSQFTQLFGGGKSKIEYRPTITSTTPNIDYIKSLIPEAYKEYLDYFNNEEQVRRDLPEWFNKNWLLYQEDYFYSRIDFHGLTKSETQFWLEYLEKNRHLFAKKVQLITGRGNNSRTRVNNDISIKILTQNDSTGILEDFVYRWLRQNRFKFIKRAGSFEITS